MTDAPTAPGRDTGFRIRGWHVAAIVCLFFGVVIAVDGAFMALALRTYPGEVSVTPYEDGLKYNQRLAQLAAQEKLGWRAAAFVTADGRLAAEVHDADGRPVEALTVTADLQRPATETGRFTLRLAEVSPGRYEARPATHGAWDVAVTARGGSGARFEAQRRLTWP